MSRATVQSLPRSFQPQPTMPSRFSLQEVTVGGPLSREGGGLPGEGVLNSK